MGRFQYTLFLSGRMCNNLMKSKVICLGSLVKLPMPTQSLEFSDYEVNYEAKYVFPENTYFSSIVDLHMPIWNN